LVTKGDGRMAEWQNEWQRNIFSQERLSKKEKEKRANRAKVQYFYFSSSFFSVLFFTQPF